NEHLAAASLLHGGDGLVPGLANVAPVLLVELRAAAARGDVAGCLRAQAVVEDLGDLHTHGHWLPALKAACAMLGLGSGLPAEAPALAELVKAGKMPPVDKRLPEEPLVIKPLQGIGRYGGTWRRGFTGPGDVENGNRIVSTDKILFWDYTGTKIMPCIAKDWKQSDDGKTVTISLRKGMKWSDGMPFTANDFVFWYEEVYT